MATDEGADANCDVQWALDLLTYDPKYKQNLISKYWPELGGTALFVIPAFIDAAYSYRTPFVRIRNVALGIIAGQVLAKTTKYIKYNNEAFRDEALRQYIIAHPDKFPTPRRKTYNDTFVEWLPIR